MGAAEAYDFFISGAPTGFFIRIWPRRTKWVTNTAKNDSTVIAMLCLSVVTHRSGPDGEGGEGGEWCAPGGGGDPAKTGGLPLTTLIRPVLTAVVNPMVRGYAAMTSRKTGLKTLLA